MTLTAEEARSQRIKRVEDAIHLDIPDRVPFFPQTNLLALQYANLSGKEAFYDYEGWFSACRKMNVELMPDLCWPPFGATPGRNYDLLGCTQVCWPGHGAPINSSIQFIDNSYMDEDELDLFIDDPTEYIVSHYLPNIFTALEPLRNLPTLKSLFFQGYKTAFTLSAFADPQIAATLKTLADAAAEAGKYMSAFQTYEQQIHASGLVSAFSGLNTLCPFDALADNFRGIKGIMTDMYRRPDKLVAAMDKLEPMLIKRTIAIGTTGSNKRVFIPLHLGADGFMSPAQFERFYWPYLKKMVLALIDAGLTPCPFFEGDYTTRLDYLTEFPRGKIMGLFDSTDLFTAKKVLGNTMCIVGNMPVSLLQAGPIDDVIDYSRRLIDVVGKDGGFIMSSRSVLDCADKGLVEQWAAFVKDYGKY